MSFLKVVSVITLMAAVTALPDSGGHAAPAHDAPAHDAPAHAAPAHGGYAPPPPPPEKPEYTFDWTVKDDYAGLDFGQNEHRDGYITEGSYFVLLPDGRVQKVTYTVNKDGGYEATVQYEGNVKHLSYTKPPAHDYTQPTAYGPPPTPAYGHA